MLKLVLPIWLVFVLHVSFIFKVLLLVSSPCIDLVLKKITYWLCLVPPVDIIYVGRDGMTVELLKLFSQLVSAKTVQKGCKKFVI